MKYSEFRRWLLKQGVKLEPHKSGSSHFKATLGDLQTSFPDHGSKEIGMGLVQKIKKDLGLK
ncbi:type II toxin-antitoxin system HicA family toxin [Achromobacter sp. LC458]|uniref:type II toxin-antitoxin system HicA family toxin n=1 Tax=Achromobacter sp. LC458 TaxID=1120623 RepID=UPI000629FD01|nr:type II toxin-antitoxin system HicA family toxin [Achromobacter sp. LC458]TRM50402.1 type II toxin-antitoxin system HicA family toxin [Achromobacter sp. LC458]